MKPYIISILIATGLIVLAVIIVHFQVPEEILPALRTTFWETDSTYMRNLGFGRSFHRLTFLEAGAVLICLFTSFGFLMNKYK